MAAVLTTAFSSGKRPPQHRILLIYILSDAQTSVGFGPYADQLQEPLNRSQVVAGSLAGEIYVAEDTATKSIVGVAIWFGPGRDMYDRCSSFTILLTRSYLIPRFISDDQRSLALQPFAQLLPAELKTWMGEVNPPVTLTCDYSSPCPIHRLRERFQNSKPTLWVRTPLSPNGICKE